MAHNFKVTGEKAFQVEAHSFAVSPSAEGYTLNYSADGVNFTACEDSTAAGDNLAVVDFARGMYFKLVGNASEVTVTY